MTIGTGIFLSSVFLGLIALFIATKDRWNWGKGLKKMALWSGAIGVVLGLSIWAYSKWEERRWETADLRPQVVTRLKEISIGEKLSDVVFRHGAFEKYERDADTVKKYHGDEDYRHKDKGLSITVREGIVTVVTYSCEKDKKSHEVGASISWEEATGLTINGIRCNDSGDKIKELFGGKVRVLCDKRRGKDWQLIRTYDVVEYGTRYFVWQNVVKGLMIADTKELESYVGINWDKCD